MAYEIPVTQARAELADLINRVVYGGERVVVTRHGKPLVALVSAADLERLRSAEQQTGGASADSVAQPAPPPANRAGTRVSGWRPSTARTAPDPARRARRASSPTTRARAGHGLPPPCAGTPRRAPLRFRRSRESVHDRRPPFAAAFGVERPARPGRDPGGPATAPPGAPCPPPGPPGPAESRAPGSRHPHRPSPGLERPGRPMTERGRDRRSRPHRPRPAAALRGGDRPRASGLGRHRAARAADRLPRGTDGDCCRSGAIPCAGPPVGCRNRPSRCACRPRDRRAGPSVPASMRGTRGAPTAPSGGSRLRPVRISVKVGANVCAARAGERDHRDRRRRQA